MNSPLHFRQLSYLIFAGVLCGGLLCGGCAQRREMMPYFGKWDGGFYIDEKGSKAPLRPLKRYVLEGYLMLYATREGFKMHLEGEQVVLDIDGTWGVTKNARGESRIQLNPKNVKIDDMGGAEFRNPNRAYIPSDAIRETYAKDLIFRPLANDQSLEGLEVSMGDLVGTHRWKRVQ